MVCSSATLAIILSVFCANAGRVSAFPSGQRCVRKCFLAIEQEHGANGGQFGFALVTFVLTYVIPLVLFCYFYLRVLLFVHSHARASSSSTGRHRSVTLWRVGRIVVGLVTAYVVCWTAYWLLNWATYARMDLHKLLGRAMIVVLMSIHATPYLSAVAYPIVSLMSNP